MWRREARREITPDEQHDGEQRDADARPHQLVGGERAERVVAHRLVAEVDAVDHRQSQPVEADDQRQQDGVGVGRDLADEQVRGDGGRDQEDHEPQLQAE